MRPISNSSSNLVFAFSVTQIAGLFASDTGPGGFARALLPAWLVWWLWSQFTWLGAAGSPATSQHNPDPNRPTPASFAVAPAAPPGRIRREE